MSKYWSEQIAEMEPLELPMKQKPISDSITEKKEFGGSLPASIMAKIEEESVSDQKLLFWSAFFILIYRYTHQKNISIWSPITNEHTDDFVFFNLKLSPHTEIRQLIDQLKERTNTVKHNLSESSAIADIPTQIVFYFDSEKKLTEENQTELSLVIQTSNNGYEAFFQYEEDLWDQRTVHQIYNHYIRILEKVKDRSELAVGDIDFFTQEEKENILYKWNDTRIDYPKDRCMHHLFEEQAARVPDNIAVVFENQQLTYRELNEKSTALAQYMQQNEIKPGDFVGIFVNRSLEMMIALFGVLKSGATYVPIDPTYPTERVGFMFEDSQLKTVITHSTIGYKIPISNDEIPRIYIDRDWDSIISSDENNWTPPTIDPESIVYMIFTSGSTGRPKAVQIPHRALTNLMCHMKQEPGITEEDYFFALASISFDMAVPEVYLPLTVGGTIEVLPNELTRDGIQLKEKLENTPVTILPATPTTWQMLLAAEWEGKADLNIWSGGEAISQDLANKLIPLGKELWNLFGPTETTVWSSITRIMPGDKINIGRPISNTEFYVFDENLKVVPVGVPGELLIGGDGVSLGYLNRDDYNKEKFIPDFITQRESGTLYRTGDLVRYLHDGTIDYIGRTDFQVKVNGYRIEVGEVEATFMKNLDGIVEIIVTVRENASGIKQLVAFVLSTNDTEESLKEKIKQSDVSQWLPAYMIPSQFIVLDSLPMTINRKVDRKTLTNESIETLRRKYGLPFPSEVKESETPTKKEPKATGKDQKELKRLVRQDVRQVGATILHIDTSQLSVKTSLGELGIDSLGLTRLCVSLNKKYNININATLFYQYPTIEAFSDYLLEEHLDGVNAAYPDINKAEPKESKKSAKNKTKKSKLHDKQSEEKVAIIGIGGTLPGCRNLTEFWDNLVKGKYGVRQIPTERWNHQLYYGDPEHDAKTNTTWGGFIDDVDKFDALFFGISPREAELMDPQQRILLETAWETIENAGYKPSSIAGTETGVFIGASSFDHLQSLWNDPNKIDRHTYSGTTHSILSNRISYILDLKGPSATIDTACSSSLVAVHRSVNSILSGECDLALAGGVNLLLNPLTYVALSKINMLSTDGKCKTFDKSANGYVRAEGVGIVLLKPLSKAKKDGDYIHGVILSSVENHGGRSNSLTAPNVNAQTEMLIRAYEKSQVDPETISYLEMHGTGTSLGDPIEINALKAAFKKLYEKKGVPFSKKNICGLGTVKTHVGHLESAAGIAGMLKVLLSMKNKTLPTNLHFQEQNPYINISETPFYYVRENSYWDTISDNEQKKVPRRAGVSSFGFGGSNAHVVLEEYENMENQKEQKEKKPQLFVLSAKNRDRLNDYARELCGFLENSAQGTISLKNLAYTLQVGRESMAERLAIIASDMTELKMKLKAFLTNGKLLKGVFQGYHDEDLLNCIDNNDDDYEYQCTLLSKRKLKKIARLWISGIDVDWQVMYKNSSPKRIPVVTYPFSRSSFRNERIEEESKTETSFFYRAQWVESSLPSHLKIDENSSPEAVLLIVPDDAITLTQALTQAHGKDKVTTIALGAMRQQHGQASLDSWENLLSRITPPDRIYFLGGIQGEEMKEGANHDTLFEQMQEQGLFSLFRLIKEMGRKQWLEKGIVLKIITNGVHRFKSDRNVNPYAGGLFGLSKVVAKEFPELKVSCLDVDRIMANSPDQPEENLIKQILLEPANEHGDDVIFREGQRYEREIVPIPLTQPVNSPYRQNGVYFILGGGGGIGQELSLYLAKKVQASLIWVGRSPLTPEQREKITEIESYGGQVLYLQKNGTDHDSMASALELAKNRFGMINGVFHSAIALNDGILERMDEDGFRKAYDPKAKGSLLLFELFKNEPLDFMLFFSSDSAFSGERGQSNYVAGSTFQDCLAIYMNMHTSYPTKVINWGYWGEVGVATDEKFKAIFERQGLLPIRTKEGLETIEKVLTQPTPQVLAIKAEERFLEKFGLNRREKLEAQSRQVKAESLNIKADAEKTQTIASPTIQISNEELQEKTLDFLKNIFADVLRLSPSNLDNHSNFEKFGVDSLMVMDLNQQIRNEFGKVPATVLYEYTTIGALADYFTVEHRQKLIEKFNIQESTNSETTIEKEDFVEVQFSETHPPQTDASEIAIIAMSSRLPMAETPEEFWNNLKNGENCIREVPEDRWDLKEQYDPTPNTVGKSYTKWAGFIDDVYCFDPLFFSITPLEAEEIDPQERLFLENTWKLLENAGYPGRELSKKEPNVGVFVGASFNFYGHLAALACSRGTYVNNFAAHYSIANRVSYFFDFHGPSFTLDSACSSSLVTVHLACESIRHGECNIAIAGGVHLLLSPLHFVHLSNKKMVSPTKECKTFGAGADGFVDGEGLGAVLLKPLEKAIADRDPILGVIKGSAVNSGGKTSGFMVPNPNAHSDLIRTALDKARINPRTISYVEAHGTGTSLGDPIEITGLKNAFETYTKDRQFCSIGSSKPNIGHLEPAAGIGGLIKVLLQMKYGQIAPSLNSATSNPNIDFEDSPFFVQQTLEEWKRPEIKIGDEIQSVPRRATVSSFGAGGTNAHVVLEEHIANPSPTPLAEEKHFFLLSARKRDRLEDYVKKMLIFLSRKNLWETECNDENHFLACLSHTLRVARSPMEERLVIFASTLEELKELLYQYLEKETNTDGIIQGNTKSNRKQFEMLFGGKTGNELIQLLIDNKEFHRMASLWVLGGDFQWKELFPGENLKLISLPNYPFEKKYFRIPNGKFEFSPIEQKELNRAENQIEYPAEYQLLERSWKECSIQPNTTESIDHSNYVIIVNSHSSLLENTLIRAGFINPILVSVQHSSDPSMMVRGFSFENEEEARKIARQVLETSELIQGVIDFSDYQDEPSAKRRGSLGKIIFLQELLKEYMRFPFTVIHATNKLQSFQTEKPTLQGADFIGLIKMLGAEYGKVVSFNLDLDVPLSNDDEIVKIVIDELNQQTMASEVCYRKGQRYLPQMVALSRAETPQNANVSPISVTPDQVFVITGGTRGIGSEIAKLLVKKGARKLVLMGRQEVPPQNEWAELIASPQTSQNEKRKLQRFLNLIEQGVQLRIYSGSLLDREILSLFMTDVRLKMGKIAGVFHLAGLENNENPAFIMKDADIMREVLEPKIEGTEVLHEIFKEDPLRFFVLYSSVSSCIPHLSKAQSDYSVANAFLDYFAEYQIKQGFPYYKSIQWPSWKEIGMGEVTSQIYKDLGFISHTTADGLAMLEHCMSYEAQACFLPCQVKKGLFDPDKLLLAKLKATPTTATKSQTITRSTESTHQKEKKAAPLNLQSYAMEWLSNMFSKELRIDLKDLDPDVDFMEFGVDSIMLTQLLGKIENWLNINLEPSKLLEYPTLNELSKDLASTCTDSLQKQASESTVNSEPISSTPVTKEPETEECVTTQKSDKENAVWDKQPQTGDSLPKIAVIGVSCQLPGANDTEEFWENLASGTHSIQEIPSSRWDIEKLYSPVYEPGKSISKWGGFLDSMEYFDPEYFKINPEDATSMDPLARKFLEVGAQCIQDAGYTQKELAKKEIGVYVGTRTANFEEKLKNISKNTVSGTGQNFIAANLSHFFNWSGPSMVVDSACSSSLLSIHLACQSLILEESEMALAGGVDALLDERPYLEMSEGKALSPDGRCFTFDEKANGLLLGEGCGAVLLKRLDNALRDGDRIHGVIDASAVNNDGHTMGLTTPNPEAQKNVIKKALENGNIDPATISYIEAHGTGTMIGDPIELKALTRLFREYTTEEGFCAIGSVKSNFGHLLSAAGISGFIKVILSLRNQQIPPTLNCDTPNPRFNFETSPFKINLALKKWEKRHGIRRAGISAFGFGGTNVHIVISEFDRNDYIQSTIREPLPPIPFQRKRYWIDPAKTEKSSDESLEKEPLQFLSITKLS